MKLFLRYPFSRIKSFVQWAVDRDPILTSTTSAEFWEDSNVVRVARMRHALFMRECHFQYIESSEYQGLAPRTELPAHRQMRIGLSIASAAKAIGDALYAESRPASDIAFRCARTK